MKISPNNCSSCGGEFICEAKNSDNCWCIKLPAVMPMDSQQNCECPNCLSKSIAKRLQVYFSENKL